MFCTAKRSKMVPLLSGGLWAPFVGFASDYCSLYPSLDTPFSIFDDSAGLTSARDVSDSKTIRNGLC